MKAIAAGYGHVLAVKQDGSLWAWGRNSDNEVGDGTDGAKYTPVNINGITGVISVTAGYGTSLATKSDGTVWTWGVRYGAGGFNDYSPVQVSGLTEIVAVASGDDFFVAVKSDGSVWAWGSDNEGRLGDGTYVDRASPAKVTGLQTSRIYLPGLVKNSRW